MDQVSSVELAVLGALSAFIWEVTRFSWKRWCTLQSKTHRLETLLRSEQRIIKVSARSLQNTGIDLNTQSYSLPESAEDMNDNNDGLSLMMPSVRMITLDLRKFDPFMLGEHSTDEVDCVDFLIAVIKVHLPDVLVAQNIRDNALFTGSLCCAIKDIGYSLVVSGNEDSLDDFSYRTQSWTLIRQSRVTLVKKIPLKTNDNCRILCLEINSDEHSTRTDDLCIIECNLDSKGGTSENVNSRLSQIHRICDEAECLLTNPEQSTMFRVGQTGSKYETIRRVPMLLVFNCPACLPYSREYRLITERKDAPVILDDPKDDGNENSWADDLSVIRWKPAMECVLGPFRSEEGGSSSDNVDFWHESRQTQHLFSTDGLRIVDYICKPVSLMSQNDRKIVDNTGLDALFARTKDESEMIEEDSNDEKQTKEQMAEKRRKCALSDCYPRCFDFEVMMDSNESAKLVSLLSELTR